MAKGRKRKQGNRTKSGQLSRAGQPRYDKGTDHAQAMQALYGQDGADAIGRAYRAGLLGEGQDAKAMLDTARRISNIYWSAYAVGGAFCTLADRSSGSNTHIPAEIARRREEWLNACLDTVNAISGLHRRSFDQLVIDVNPDCGPAWLDRLCFATRSKYVYFEPADTSALDRALDALSEIAGVEKPRIATLKAA